MRELARPTSLDEIGTTLALSQTEMARLFGVQRQSLADWTRRGIPSARQSKVAGVAAVCDLLRHYLRVERIPGIARTPAAAYGGLTMLEMIEQDRHQELRELIHDSLIRDSLDPLAREQRQAALRELVAEQTAKWGEPDAAEVKRIAGHLRS